MAKIAIYLLLVLSYFGFSRLLKDGEYGVATIKDARDLVAFINEPPFTALLTDIENRGFIIKSHYLKFRIIYAYQKSKEIIVRVPKKYLQRFKENIGMAFISQLSRQTDIDYSITIPGLIFTDNSAFGRWRKNSDQQLEWKFYRAYQEISPALGWEDFNMTKSLYQEAINAKLEKNIFYGDPMLFGSMGIVTQRAFPRYFQGQKKVDINFKDFVMEYFKRSF